MNYRICYFIGVFLCIISFILTFFDSLLNFSIKLCSKYLNSFTKLNNNFLLQNKIIK